MLLRGSVAPEASNRASAPRPSAQDEVSEAVLGAASGTRTVRIGVSSGGARQPVDIPLEIYVARVLAGEGEPRAADAAQQALAVAIRTFVGANRGRHQREGFDLCDTTHCQVMRTSSGTSRRAVLATAGKVLLHDGRPAELFYSASCGGRSELPSAVWPGMPDYPYLVAADDDVHEADTPWVADLSQADTLAALRRAGFTGRHLTGVVVEARNSSGRVARVSLAGLRPPTVSGAELRMALGPTLIRSTAFTVEPSERGFRFTGRGYGHGVGMCVIGAGRRAAAGESMEAILARYYPGLALGVPGEKVPASEVRLPVDANEDSVLPLPPATRTATSLPPAAVVPAPPAASAGPVQVWVAPEAGIEGGVLARMATQAFSELSRELGTSVAPVSIRMHGSMDAFRRATGRPWWVSSVVTGSAIDLPPATVLAQRDGPGPALRTAMAEVLTSSALSRRPLWVRVGAARYYGRGALAGRPASTGKLVCPTESELAAALSAPAQREAEVRAEACFARGLARTRDWRQVR